MSHSHAAAPNLAGPRNQRGISLLVVLVLLIVTSILGIAVLRSSAMQERMAGNLRDRSLAFQAAETALRYAQDAVLGNTAIVDLQYGKTLAELRAAGKPANCAADGICNRDPTSGTLETPVKKTVPGTQSTYTIEYLGTGKGTTVKGVCETTAAMTNYQCQRPMFRVTVVGVPVNTSGNRIGRSEVMLQANIISR